MDEPREKPYEDSFNSHPYLKLIEDSPDGYILLDDHGKGLYANKKAQEMLLRPADEIVGHEIGFPLLVGDNTELELPRKDGSVSYVELRTVETMWKGRNAYLCNFRDVTDRKEYENELQRHQELLEQTGQLARVGGWEVNLGNNTVYWSKTTKMIHDVPMDYEPTVEEAIDFFPGESKTRINEALDEAINNNKPYDLILEFYTAKGRHLWVHTLGKPEMFKGRCIRLWGVIQDITARKEAEIQLEKAKEKAEESDRLKTAFIANISHEIRTPMNGIMGFANLLKEPGLEGSKQEEFIEIIHQSGNRMLNIINELIDIAKIESGQMEVKEEETSVNDLVDGLCDFFSPEAGSKGLTLKTSKPEHQPNDTLFSDPDKLDQILKNLIKNAIKYTDAGTIEFGYKPADSEFLFFVSDTGLGIDPEVKEKIFERFRQADITISRQFEGAGLGLSISKAYVEMLGGKIWLESEREKGSTFLFTVPNKQGEKTVRPSRDADYEEPGEGFLDGLTILVAEDDPVSYKFFVEMLRDKGIAFIRCDNGREAVEKINNQPGIDLVLMDIKMPVMDGYEATRRIKESHPEIPVVAQTAFASRLDEEKAFRAGCDAYLSKPVREKKFFQVLNKLLKDKKIR